MFKSFDELAQARRAWVQQTDRNGFDFTELLSGIYANPAHFVYELLQNAEDAGATRIEFELQTDRLLVSHDGRPFTLSDVEGVTGISRSAKSTDLTKLGRFGVGFKSVFAVTGSPEVYSGQYRFRIEELVVPVRVDSQVGESGKTVFVLPFDHETRGPEDVGALVRSELSRLGVDGLLFLRSLRSVSWVVGEERTTWTRTARRRRGVEGATQVAIEGGGARHEYLLFFLACEIGDGALWTSVAYRVDHDRRNGYRLVAEDEALTALSVYFPTERQTGLRFRVNGPFRTTVNRENVPFDDATDNRSVLKDLGRTVRHSIGGLSTLGMLSPEAFGVLALDADRFSDPVYSAVRGATLDALRSDGVLPTSGGGSARASEVALPGDARLPGLMTGADLASLFGRRRWAHPRLAEVAAIRSVLQEGLQIPHVDVSDVVKQAPAAWYETKHDRWLVSFYGLLEGLTMRTLWREGARWPWLGGFPIVRLETGAHAAAVDGRGTPQAYLPVAGRPTVLPTVRRAVADDEKARALLVTIGLREPDALAEVEEVIIPTLVEGDGRYDAWSQFEVLVLAYRQASDVDRRRLREKLSGLACLPGVVDGEKRPVAPKDAYFHRPDLVAYFGHSAGTAFLDPAVSTSNEDVIMLLRGLRVGEYPRRVNSPVDLTVEEKERLRKGKRVARQETRNVTIDGLNGFLDSPPSLARSAALWRLLLLALADRAGYFRGEYRYTPRTKTVPVSFDGEGLRLLRRSPWLYGRDGVVTVTSELSLDTLHPEYDRKRDQVEILAEALELQPEARRSLPEEERAILDTLAGYTHEDVLEMMELLEASRGSDGGTGVSGWESDVEPGASGSIRDFVPAEPRADPGEPTGAPSESAAGRPRRARPSKPVGQWGEAHVAALLKKEYPDCEVVWLNEGGSEQTGYDIRVERDGDVVEYAEVKSSAEAGPVIIELSGAQWDFASALYRSGDGALYVVYVVPGAGTANADPIRIENPVERWLHGQLWTHGVTVEVRSD